ncbi:DinB family protein [Fictibacillus halophilus]|uniref:DinB family protein n=1 Tax=Fictibacillus halophilus TaxID=1610490 RepID=UPI003631CBD0
MNLKEYEWVKENRNVLLNFCCKVSREDFTREIGYGWQSVQYTLVHIADCYIGWLGSFVLLQTKTPITPKENVSHMNIDDIKKRFKIADSYVHDVLHDFGNKMDKGIHRPIPWRNGSDPITLTPEKLLMHTITHEYHHKGQIMAMIKQMGYEPPNTDVLSTKN